MNLNVWNLIYFNLVKWNHSSEFYSLVMQTEIQLLLIWLVGISLQQNEEK